MSKKPPKTTNMPKVSRRRQGRGRHDPIGRRSAPMEPSHNSERRAMTEIAERIRLRDQAEADAKIAEALEIANARLSETLDPAEVARLSTR